MSDEAYLELRMARNWAHRDLLEAERAERKARNARTTANRQVGRYETLLEMMTTDPLFDLEK